MKKIIYLILLLIFVVSVGFASAAPITPTSRTPLQEAFIKYKKTGWQTYEFWILTNSNDESKLSYEWTVDNKETYNTKSLRYFFPKGEHLIKAKVEDEVGNVRYDSMRLTVHFWSLQNNWFWWAVYLIVVLIIFYYWVVKIVYLLNRRKLGRQVREFLDILDDHGWVERIIARHAKRRVAK